MGVGAFLLMVVIFIPNTGDPLTTFTGDFYSKEACETAADEVRNNFTGIRVYSSTGTEVRTVCLTKN